MTSNSQNVTFVTRQNSAVSIKTINETVAKLKFMVTFCQMFIILIVILTCIACLAMGKGNAEMWISFFGLAFGAVLPSPKVKKLFVEPTFQLHEKQRVVNAVVESDVERQ